MIKTKSIIALICLLVFSAAFLWLANTSKNHTSHPANIATVAAVKRSYPIDVRTIGELEASKSTNVCTAIRSDQPKVLSLVTDGTFVDTGHLIITLDPTPYEKKIEELQAKIQDLESQITSLEKAEEWEKVQAEQEYKAIIFEGEVAKLELNKVIRGDGPLEVARLHAGMQKAKSKYEELDSYSNDLIALEEQGFMNPAEVKQIQKKLVEEHENYENAKLQYDSFVEHVHPMQIKKAETAVERNLAKQEETLRASKYKIGKAQGTLQQAKQELANLQRQIKEAKNELALTEIRAPSSGMVVLKDDYRGGQRRKPRVGDTLIRNQTILDIPDMSSMIVKTKVREIDLYKVDIGKPASIEVDAYPNLVLHGTVCFIGILAISDVASLPGEEKYFEVKVALTDFDNRLRPGMTSRVVIHSGKVDNGISLPIHSVFEFDKKNYCFIATSSGYEMRLVNIGMNNEQWVEIVSGLNEGDQVALSLPPEEFRIKILKNDF